MAERIEREQNLSFREAQRRERIRRNKEKRQALRRENAQEIRSSFVLTKERKSARRAAHADALYSSLSFLCDYLKIPIVAYETLRSAMHTYTVEDIARLSDFDIRRVETPEDIASADIGPVLAFMGEEGKPVAITNKRGRHKYYFDPEIGSLERLDPEKAAGLGRMVCQIYRPLGDGAFTGKKFFHYAMQELSAGDFAFILLGMSLVTFVSLSLSRLNERMYNRIIPQGDIRNLLAYGGILMSFMAASLFFGILQSLASFRVSSKLKYSLQASIYGRIFRMKESFYRSRDSAELAWRAGTLPSCYISVFTSIMTVILQLLFSMFYFRRMMSYSAQLGLLGLLLSSCSALLTAATGLLLQNLQSRRSLLKGRIRAYLYQAFYGIEAVRTAGAEDFVLHEYVKKASECGSLTYEYDSCQKISAAASMGVGAVSTILIYSLMGAGAVSMSIGAFMGFVSVFSAFSAAFGQVSGSVMMIFRMLPVLRNSSDILKTPPESASKGVLVSGLEGRIDLSHVTFAYDSWEEPILRDVSLSIRPGEYVGIVGRSGCGKSTLLRLLLGFEKPMRGQIAYDGINLETLNPVQLRRHLGVALQDGGLFNGSIYSNIKGTAPDASEEDIAFALKASELEPALNEMPLGVMTPVMETAGGVSGGQKQRILIARALAKKPKVLIFDEATSALDNETQAKISAHIAQMNATRIVVAHRLSTVQDCDRIVVLDKGVFSETGTYSELMEKRGMFYELVRNQVL